MPSGGIPAQPAPLYAEVAEGPADGQAQFLRTDDGLRIRVAHWGHDAPSGTVLLFPGRTEFVEKYGRAATDLRARGFATMAVDWRGQGLAARLLDKPALGHVIDFSNYQRDVATMLAHARAVNLPQPFFLLGHSMGGCIALRSVFNGVPVQAVAFTAPMWGIRMGRGMRPVAWGLSGSAALLRLGHLIVPGQTTQTYVLRQGFSGNDLTGDRGMFDYMTAQLQAYPDLALGGPTLQWLNAALRETRRLTAMPAPAVPALTFLGTEESIVEVTRIQRRMDTWPGAELRLVAGARHEVMMETPSIRAMVFDAIAAHFIANS